MTTQQKIIDNKIGLLNPVATKLKNIPEICRMTIKPKLFLLLFIFVAFKGKSQIINQKVTCPIGLIEKIKKSPPGFYYDSEYFENLKVGNPYQNYVLIKVPLNGKEAKAMKGLKIHLPVVPDSSKLLFSSLDVIEDLQPGVTLTFENKKYKPYEIVCILVKGVTMEAGQWIPKVKMKSDAKLLFTSITAKSTWTGLKVVVN